MIPLTVVIPVKNEEINLPRCFKALDSFSHVLVADSDSTDLTPQIARDAGAEIINFQWNGQFPKKRNWILQNYNFTTDWVLFLDADEIVSDEFKKEVESAIQVPEVNGYWLTFHNYFQGKLLKYGIPFRKLALFRIGKGEYERIDENRWSTLDMEVHEHPIIEGTIGVIKAPVIHNDYKGMYHYLARHNEYSSWEAARYFDIKKKGLHSTHQLTARQRKKYRSLDKWWWASLYFFSNYFIRLGFLDGREGFVFSFLKAVYFFEIRCKIKELENKK